MINHAPSVIPLYKIFCANSDTQKRDLRKITGTPINALKQGESFAKKKEINGEGNEENSNAPCTAVEQKKDGPSPRAFHSYRKLFKNQKRAHRDHTNCPALFSVNSKSSRLSKGYTYFLISSTSSVLVIGIPMILL